MEIKIVTLRLTNFKGIRSLTIQFGDITSVYGANATGKSTIADAFTWLLFGKNTNDQKDFEIKTLDEHGQVISRIDHEVAGVLHIDGRPVTLKRTLREKWVKKHGETEQVFTGNETIFSVNDVAKSLSEYQSYINEIIPEATFKLLTSPTYFNSIKWQDRREILTGIAKIPDDDTIAGNDLSGVLKRMREERKSLSDLKKESTSKKSKLKDAIDQIPARLDEIDKATPDQQDFEAIEKRITEVKEGIASCDAQIEDKSKGVQEQIKIRSNVQRIKGDLNDKITNLTSEARRKVSEQSGSKENKVASINQNIRFRTNRVKELNDEILRIGGLVTFLNDTNSKLRDEVATINAKVFDSEGITTTCPTCKQSLPEGDINAKVEEMSASFNTDKSNKIAEINRRGLANKQTISNHEAAISNLHKEIEGINAEITKFEIELKEAEATVSNPITIEEILASNPEYNKTLAELEALVLPDVEEVDTTELKEVKADYQAELETLQRLMSTKDTIASLEARKQQLLNEEQTLSQELSMLEGFEQQITDFTNRKMKAVEDSVNDMFPTVRFKMFDVQINGGIAETCETLINGVPYSDSNSAAKHNAGIEIINVFSKIFNLSAPIWLDNAESIIKIGTTNSQFIGLYVKDCPLTVVS